MPGKVTKRTPVRPAIYTLVAESVVGELGERTVIARGAECPDCHRRKLPVYRRVDYAFDRWNGEDLVTAMTLLFVSKRLAAALDAASIAGIRIEPATTSKNDGFHLGEAAYARRVPPFFRLRLLRQADGPETWVTSKPCTTCGRRAMRPTQLGLSALSAGVTRAPLPVREVFADTWKGADIFTMPDGYRAVVTQRFRDVIDRVNPKDAMWGPGRWVVR